ncbi:MAG: hypothetical protein FJ303_04450 [Planctomycetes bacterium]|nr:hypothetical protein [Planctomycetota bacterium]
MSPRRYRCALWASLLLAGASMTLAPPSVSAQGSFSAGLKSAIHDVTDLIDMSVDRHRPRSEMHRLDRALHELLRIYDHVDHHHHHHGRFAHGARYLAISDRDGGMAKSPMHRGSHGAGSFASGLTRASHELVDLIGMAAKRHHSGSEMRGLDRALHELLKVLEHQHAHRHHGHFSHGMHHWNHHEHIHVHSNHGQHGSGAMSAGMKGPHGSSREFQPTRINAPGSASAGKQKVQMSPKGKSSAQQCLCNLADGPGKLVNKSGDSRKKAPQNAKQSAPGNFVGQKACDKQGASQVKSAGKNQAQQHCGHVKAGPAGKNFAGAKQAGQQQAGPRAANKTCPQPVVMPREPKQPPALAKKNPPTNFKQATAKASKGNAPGCMVGQKNNRSSNPGPGIAKNAAAGPGTGSVLAKQGSGGFKATPANAKPGGNLSNFPVAKSGINSNLVPKQGSPVGKAAAGNAKQGSGNLAAFPKNGPNAIAKQMPINRGNQGPNVKNSFASNKNMIGNLPGAKNTGRMPNVSVRQPGSNVKNGNQGAFQLLTGNRAPLLVNSTQRTMPMARPAPGGFNVLRRK